MTRYHKIYSLKIDMLIFYKILYNKYAKNSSKDETRIMGI